MKIVVRRRLAVGAVAVSTAVIAGLAAAPAAVAGNVTNVTPSFAYNDDTSEQITVTTQSNFVPDPLAGGNTTITLKRTGAATDSFSADSDAYTAPNQPRATFNFADTGSGDNDGPANPGLYDVDVQDNVGSAHDACNACFQVFSAATLGLTSAAPKALPAGGADNVTFTGAGFARGTKLEFLLPGTSTVDPKIVVSAPLTAGSFQQCGGPQACQVPNPTRTTSSTLLRRIAVDVSDNSGLRDVRVTNTDGSTATCPGCFTVNGAPLNGVSPNAVDNSPSATPTVRITFSGANVPSGGTPYLVFVGDAGSSTKDALTLKGSNPTYSSTAVSADFDFRSAAPGVNAYVPTLVAADGSTNTCSCSFSVGQAAAPAVTSLSPNTAAQSDSRTVTINGSNFSRGLKIAFSGTGITVTSVQFVSATQVRASITVQAAAAAGKRDVTASTTKGPASDTTYPRTSAACTGCFTITSTGSGSPSPSATATSTISPSPGQCPTNPVRVQVNGSGTINATGKASVTVFGAQANSRIELQGYSQNHFQTMNFDNDPTPVDRAGTTDSSGAITFSDIGPSSNTRFRARQVGCSYGDERAVLEVRAQETLLVKRNGTRSYTFSGRSIPAREGGLIVSLYRITGSSCAAGVEPSKCPGETFIGQGRAVAKGQNGEGLYSINITFPKRDQNVRDEFVVKTGRDAQNAPGRSNVRSLLIS